MFHITGGLNGIQPKGLLLKHTKYREVTKIIIAGENGVRVVSKV